MITRIDNNTFDVFKNIQLKELSFQCKIRYVEPGALIPFQSIESLDISNNFYVRLSYLLQLLNGLMDRNVTSINFYNNFRTVPAADVLLASQFAMIGAVCLKEIDLTRHRIISIQSGGISLMKHKNCLEKLILKENSIWGDRIVIEIAKLVNLRWLDISNQATLHVKTKVNKNKICLRRLDMTDTNYSSDRLTIAFQLPRNLQYIDVSYFGVRSSGLVNLNFTNAGKLDFLNLAGNKFKDCLGHFHGLSHLQTLDISDFNCSELDLKMISFMPYLKTLISRRTHLNVGLQNDVNASVIAYKYRITLHFWYLHIRRKYRLYTALEGDSKEYKHNAFVAYCNEDEEWVCGSLVNYLEKKNGLALCLHTTEILQLGSSLWIIL
ncbi:unnamed protein product [Mytilus coruscus]|uniref:Uncharacterized protein n=1 Tax=Mytilus coruscus TaxID=42192 RepID=A0A6J8A1A4_MYTCO|nr:unnamed protein product [Mytilus coruscus]